MEVAQVQLAQLVDDVAELGDGVGHAHALEVGPGRQTDTDTLLADGVDDGLGDLGDETGPVLDAATPGVGPLVAGVLVELVDQVAVGGVDLHAVKAALLDGVLGRGGVVVDGGQDLLLGQGTRGGTALVHGDGAGADIVVLVVERVVGERAAGADGVGVRGTTQVPELDVGLAALGVDGIVDLLPCGQLGLGPQAGDVGVATGLGGDIGGLGDDEGSGDDGTLGVILCHDIGGHMVRSGSETGQRCHHDAVVELSRAHLERLEELGVFGHCGWYWENKII